MQRDLDQLWYTWSPNGLDAIAMDYRVRAASGELHNTQSLRYRTLDRFLRYNPPQNMNSNELDARTAPVSYAFLSNGSEHLLVRKVFKGRDLAGRNSVYFTHLIAGLPDEFTARDAIRLWNSRLWVESEDGKAANDTLLNPIPYQDLKRAADQASQPLLPFDSIRTKLEDLLLAILCQNGLTQEVYLVGHASLAAALIYGLTHCLPLSLLGNFTFSTYESTVNEIDATFLTTITGAELADLTRLDIRPVDLPQANPAGIEKYRNYVTFVVTMLMARKSAEFLPFLKEMEERGCQSADQLIQNFNLDYGQGTLTFPQIETIITHPTRYTRKLLDAAFQQQSATVLLDPEQMGYWQKHGQKTFQLVVAQLASPTGNLPEAARQALSSYLNGLAPYFLNALADGLKQVKLLETQGQAVAWNIPRHCGDLLDTLLPPAQNEHIWLRALDMFAQQPQFFAYLKSDPLWPFQLWLLEQAGKLPQPQRFLAQVQPWLDIPSWDKLERVLDLQLPAEWIYAAIYGRMQDVPKGAVSLIQKYEHLFLAALRHLQQQGGQANFNLASNFFQKMVEYSYSNRVSLLLTLVNTYAEAGFVQTIFSCVDLATPSRLSMLEIRTVLDGCSADVIATCNRSQALASYLQEFLLTLTPAQLNTGNTFQILTQLSQLSAGPGLPPLFAPEIADLVNHWLMVNAFLNFPTLDRHLLAKTKTAIEHILRYANPTSVKTPVQIFADEFIPMLVQKAQSESDLETILDILDKTMTGSRWHLLLWMNLLMGQRQPKARLYELFPYLTCGMREAERSHQTDHDLATYLQQIFVGQEKEILRSIDTIVNEGIWPDVYRRRWETWRKRGKKGFSLPGLPARGNTSRLSAPQQAIVLSDPNKQAAPPANVQQQAIYGQPVNVQQPAVYVPPARNNVPPQPGYVAPSRQEVAPPVQQPPRTVVTLQALGRSISYEDYRQIHSVISSLLDYWLKHKFPEKKGIAKSHKFEIETLQRIDDDLRQSPKNISQNLVLYLVDDVLIAETVQSKTTPQSNVAMSLDPEKYLQGEFENIETFIQVDSSSELLYKQGLRLLIRRYLALNYLESNPKGIFGKGDFLAFLEREREKAQLYTI